ncbi:MAG: Ldh family oxidoreductase [Candidatus Omnitrophica bacterium]|nr:Ldh family oxidoreductase [Candidatus Omnitrophota bacterium]
MSEPQKIPADKLIAFGQAILQKVGIPGEDAAIVARVLVESNLRGVDTHGIYLVNLYSRPIEKGW